MSFYKYFPVIGFSFIWIVILILHNSLLFNLKPISADTWLILVTGLLSFVLTYILFGVFDKSLSSNPVYNFNQFIDLSALTKLVLSLSLLTTLGGILIAISISTELGGLDIYFKRPLLVRQTVVDIQQNKLNGTPLLFRLGNYLFNIGVLATFLGGILFSQKGKTRLIGILPIFALFFAQITLLGRFTFVNGVGTFIIAFTLVSYFGTDKERIKRLIEIFFYTVFSLTAIIILSYYILKWRSPLADDIILLVKKTFYLYFVGGITGFDRVLEVHQSNPSFGESSFRSIYTWLARLGVFPKEEVANTHNQFLKVTPNFNINTFTYMNSLYQDFRIYGTILISSIWGGISQISVSRVYRKPTLTSLFICSIIVYSSWISFFSFYFQSITKLVYWVLILLLINFIHNKKLKLGYENTR